MNTQSVHSAHNTLFPLMGRYVPPNRLAQADNPRTEGAHCGHRCHDVSQRPLQVTENQAPTALAELPVSNPAASVSDAALLGYAAQSRQSAELEIITNEGDVVKIRLTQSSASSQMAASISRDGLQASAARIDSSYSANFAISVEGNLNADEQKSIEDLLRKMDSVSREFFAGDVQGAFDHVQAIGLDQGQLAGFALDLSAEKSVQAVAAYVQTQQSERRVNPEKIRQASDFSRQVTDLLSAAQAALQPFPKPLPAFMDLLNTVIQVGAADSNTASAANANSATTLPLVIEPSAAKVLGA